MVNRIVDVAILGLLLLGVVVRAEEETDHAENQTQLPRLTTAQIWGFGTLAGIGISAIGFFAAFLLLIAKKCCSFKFFETLVKFLFSLSCGALVGDAIIHILSEAYASQTTNSKIVSLVFILSIFSFLIIDRVLHAVGIAHSHWVGEKCEGERENHGHHHHELSNDNHNHKIQNEDQEQNKNENNVNSSQKKQGKTIKELGSQTTFKKVQNNFLAQSQVKQSQNQQTQKQKKCCYSLRGKDSAGYINIMGSLIHNFIDGLALGVAFATGNPTEIVPVLVAIIAHQIPRQLGDVAILLRSSFSEVQTMLCNGVVNFVSLIGVFIGLAVVNLDQVTKTYIMVFVAGNFIYIASDIWQHILKNKGQSAKCGNLLEFFGLSVGVGSMFALTLMETQSGHDH